MNTNGGKGKSVTSISIGGWKKDGNIPQLRSSKDTCGIGYQDVVLVQAKTIHDKQGATWIVQLEPASVGQKLLIRRMNDELMGKTFAGRTEG